MVLLCMSVFAIGVAVGLGSGLLWCHGDVVLWRDKWRTVCAEKNALHEEYSRRLDELSRTLGVDTSLGDIVVPLCHVTDDSGDTEALEGCEDYV